MGIGAVLLIVFLFSTPVLSTDGEVDTFSNDAYFAFSYACAEPHGMPDCDYIYV